MSQAAARSAAPTGFGSNDVQVLAGSFDEFTFDDIVQVLSLSRQCLRLMVQRGDASFSEILLKAGQVLDARAPGSSDPEKVFQTLVKSALRGSGLSFAVYHTEPNGPFPTPKGKLHDIYARATSMAHESARSFSPPTAEVHGQAASPVAATHPSSSMPGALTLSLLPETLGKALLADLQPMLRQELETLRRELRDQGQRVDLLDGRLQALPQLVSADVRLALAQRERQAPKRPPTPIPPPTPPPARADSLQSALLPALAGGFVVLLVAVVLLAIRVLR